MDNGSSGLTAADVLALTKNGNTDMMGGGYFWWVIIFFIIAGMFGGNGIFGGRGTNENQTEFIANQFSNQNDKFLSSQNHEAINQVNRDVLESSFATTKEVLENRYNNSLQTNTLQAQLSTNALQNQMQLSNCCCTLREEGVANTQKILDKLCQSEIDNLRERLAERDRELQTARFQISQIGQTANITNTLRPYPTPSYIVSSPYTSLYSPYYGTAGVV